MRWTCVEQHDDRLSANEASASRASAPQSCTPPGLDRDPLAHLSRSDLEAARAARVAESADVIAGQLPHQVAGDEHGEDLAAHTQSRLLAEAGGGDHRVTAREAAGNTTVRRRFVRLRRR